jgi:hypothetical protein
MAWLRKPVVDKYEKEFKTDRLRDKHLFYDLNIRVGDPEELRTTAVELLADSDYTIRLNEMTKFEDKEFDKMFMGGRLKPLKSIIKAGKNVKKGPKFPLLWKIFVLLGLAFLALRFISPDMFGGEPTNNLLYAGIFFLLLSLAVYMIKKIVPLALWIKIVGIYNVEDQQADIRLVLAGDTKKKDKEAFGKLEDELSEIYSVLARKYMKKIDKKQIVKSVKIETKKDETAENKIQTLMIDLDRQIRKLEKNLVEGKVSEDTYNELKGKLKNKKDKLETLYDLLSV